MITTKYILLSLLLFVATTASAQVKFSDLKERLAIAVKLESIQKRKFEDLRKLRARGLTIAFQVFQYELDYMSASLARVQIEGMLLGTWSQLKLFERET